MDNGPAGGGDAEEFAREKKPLEGGLEREPMKVCYAQRQGKIFARLIRLEAKIGQALCLDTISQFTKPHAIADEQKDDVRNFAQPHGRAQEGFGIMCPS